MRTHALYSLVHSAAAEPSNGAQIFRLRSAGEQMVENLREFDDLLAGAVAADGDPLEAMQAIENVNTNFLFALATGMRNLGEALSSDARGVTTETPVGSLPSAVDLALLAAAFSSDGPAAVAPTMRRVATALSAALIAPAPRALGQAAEELEHHFPAAVSTLPSSAFGPLRAVTLLTLAVADASLGRKRTERELALVLGSNRRSAVARTATGAPSPQLDRYRRMLSAVEQLSSRHGRPS